MGHTPPAPCFSPRGTAKSHDTQTRTSLPAAWRASLGVCHSRPLQMDVMVLSPSAAVTRPVDTASCSFSNVPSGWFRGQQVKAGITCQARSYWAPWPPESGRPPLPSAHGTVATG